MSGTARAYGVGRRTRAAHHPNLYAAALVFCGVAAVVNAVVLVIHAVQAVWLSALWNAAVLAFWLRVGGSFWALVAHPDEQAPPTSFQYWPFRRRGSGSS